MKARNHPLSLVAAVLAVALAAAVGCGSTVAGGSGTTIVIGSVGDYSGPLASTFGAVPTTLDAWAGYVNAHGGVDGHQVRLINKDIADATGGGQSAVKELISQDHAVAVINFDSSDATWLPYAQQQGVPVIESQPTFGSMLTPDAFPVVTGFIPLLYSILTTAKSKGTTFATAYCAEDPSCAVATKLFQTFDTGLGERIAVASALSSAAPDYTAFCQQVRASRVASYWLSLPSAVAAKVTQQCVQQGVSTPQIADGEAFSPLWKTDPAYNGLTVIDETAPYFDTALPAIKQFRDVLAASAGTVAGSPEDNPALLYAWAGAQLIAKVAPRTGAVTAATIRSGLYALHGETLGGITQPLTYHAGTPAVLNCWFVWTVHEGQFSVSDAAAPWSQCAPDEVIATATKAAMTLAGK